MKKLTEKELKALAFWASIGVSESRGGSYQNIIEGVLKRLKQPAKFYTGSGSLIRNTIIDSLIRKEIQRLKPRLSTVHKILALKKLGYSNTEIAKRHHISRERVRQQIEWFYATFTH